MWEYDLYRPTLGCPASHGPVILADQYTTPQASTIRSTLCLLLNPLGCRAYRLHASQRSMAEAICWRGSWSLQSMTARGTKTCER
ncbi:hypothetical protein CR513_33259, partial [Mucuna pruriens]